MTDRITYYQIQGYPGDFTKYCSLNGVEIDNNFLTLEGRDVKSVRADGDLLIITLYNGKTLTCNITSLVTDITVGEGIDQAAFSTDKIITTNAGIIETTQDMVVSGDCVGSYNPGDVVPAGTSVEEILKNLLVKIYSPTTELPTSTLNVKINGANIGEVYEVGTELGTCALSVTWTDGMFVGNEVWSYTINAQCSPIQTNYLYDGTLLGSVSGVGNKNYAPAALTEGTHTFKSNTQYGASQATPEKSDGTPASVSIPAGTTPYSEKSFKASYKYFYGYIAGRSNANYQNVIPDAQTLRSLNFNTGFCTINGTTEIPYMQSIEGKTSLVLVLPQKYRTITRTENSMYVPVTISEKWKLSGTISDYTVGNSNPTYYVYVLHNMLPIRYNNIEFE